MLSSVRAARGRCQSKRRENRIDGNGRWIGDIAMFRSLKRQTERRALADNPRFYLALIVFRQTGSRFPYIGKLTGSNAIVAWSVVEKRLLVIYHIQNIAFCGDAA
ncbi:hypothetical protein [Paraburkholderia acidisoli]|uniref:Uncharacterized protein n=1 Tax=Paraburkholderia acidisoli TaxID=2571748 RepID=A0A7Z2GLM8_9BURK|nr:hypothetical protein [Paraburkholderia acidisoli]QGZ63911.1 hypothetical protein FAZ98_19385 [Paraburkholderia acidisoli]